GGHGPQTCGTSWSTTATSWPRRHPQTSRRRSGPCSPANRLRPVAPPAPRRVCLRGLSRDISGVREVPIPASVRVPLASNASTEVAREGSSGNAGVVALPAIREQSTTRAAAARWATGPDAHRPGRLPVSEVAMRIRTRWLASGAALVAFLAAGAATVAHAGVTAPGHYGVKPISSGAIRPAASSTLRVGSSSTQGVVAVQPKVYLVFWGSQWTQDPA